METFRGRHWGGQLPVDVLEIAEVKLGLSPIPVHDLMSGFGVDAILLSNLQQIVVDKREYMDDRAQNRLRFSVAHELGHLELHGNLVKQLPPHLEDRLKFQQQIDERQYGFFEWQANEFAGRLLVPPVPFSATCKSCMQQARTRGGAKAETDYALDWVCEQVGRRFGVSADVIVRRLRAEGMDLKAL